MDPNQIVHPTPSYVNISMLTFFYFQLLKLFSEHYFERLIQSPHDILQRLIQSPHDITFVERF